MLYGGVMYYFCSEQDRAAFAKDPSKYALPAADQAPPAHAH
jgi:YHS domain-containing protein